MSLLDKIIQRVLNLINWFLNKPQQAKLATFFTRVLVDKKNSIQFDKNLDQFWLVHDAIYLDVRTLPKYYFEYRDYSNEMKEVFLKNYSPNNGDIIIDLGAGVGTELYFYSKKVSSKGKIYAIEASPDSFSILKQLSKKNQFDNVSLHHLAITEKTGHIWIEQRRAYNANQINKEQRGVKVSETTLDNFVENNNIKKINLLKVNIEGAELNLIKGMSDSIHIIENIAISCHDFIFEHDTQITKTIVDYFEHHNFKISYNNTGIQYIDSWIYGKKKKKLINITFFQEPQCQAS